MNVKYITFEANNNKMEATIIRSIIVGYENQLLNAEIKKDKKQIKWLTQQINAGNKAIAQFGTYKNK